MMKIHIQHLLKVDGVIRTFKLTCLYGIQNLFSLTSTKLFSARHTDRSASMLKSNLRAMPLLQCNTTILPALPHGIGRSQFCAYDPNDLTQSCRILSGGALQTYPSMALLSKIVGITSFGFGGGCNSKQPGIFTRVAHYVPWIEANVWPFDRSMYNKQICQQNMKFDSVRSSEIEKYIK